MKRETIHHLPVPSSVNFSFDDESVSSGVTWAVHPQTPQKPLSEIQILTSPAQKELNLKRPLSPVFDAKDAPLQSELANSLAHSLAYTSTSGSTRRRSSEFEYGSRESSGVRSVGDESLKSLKSWSSIQIQRLIHQNARLERENALLRTKAENAENSATDVEDVDDVDVWDERAKILLIVTLPLHLVILLVLIFRG